MGRDYVVRTEPLTTLSIYKVDSLLLDAFKRPSETNKADTLRRIFLDYFGKDIVEAKKDELRKKVYRHELDHSDNVEQSTIDTVYYPKKQFKDIEYNSEEIIEIVKKGRKLKGELADRYAADSIQKAVNRGDLSVNPENQTFTIVRKWF